MSNVITGRANKTQHPKTVRAKENAARDANVRQSNSYGDDPFNWEACKTNIVLIATRIMIAVILAAALNSVGAASVNMPTRLAAINDRS